MDEKFLERIQQLIKQQIIDIWNFSYYYYLSTDLFLETVLYHDEILLVWRSIIIFIILLSLRLVYTTYFNKYLKELGYDNKFFEIFSPKFLLGFLPFPYRYYTLPYLKEENKNSTFTYHEMRNRIQDPNRNDYKYILIKAEAGFGKSALLIYSYLDFLIVPDFIEKPLLKYLYSYIIIAFNPIKLLVEFLAKSVFKLNEKIVYKNLGKIKYKTFDEFIKSFFEEILEIKKKKAERKTFDILFLDALDEVDSFYTQNEKMSILDKIADFLKILDDFPSAVIISVRNQFFIEELSKKIVTPIARGNENLPLTKLEIQPFNRSQVNWYLIKKFHIQFWKINLAKSIIYNDSQNYKDIFKRPFLLHYIQEFLVPWYVFNDRYLLKIQENKLTPPSKLVTDIKDKKYKNYYNKQKAIERISDALGTEDFDKRYIELAKPDYSSLFLVYEELVDKWLHREAGKFGLGDSHPVKKKLYEFHKEVTLYLYKNNHRMEAEKLKEIAIQFFSTKDGDFVILHSMLAATFIDGKKFYEFSHRSLYEYFLADIAYFDYDFYWNSNWKENGFIEAESFYKQRCYDNDFRKFLYENKEKEPVYSDAFTLFSKYPKKDLKFIFPNELKILISKWNGNVLVGLEYALKKWNIAQTVKINLAFKENNIPLEISKDGSTLLEQLKKIKQLSEYPKNIIYNEDSYAISIFRNLQWVFFGTNISSTIIEKVNGMKQLELVTIHSTDFSNLKTIFSPSIKTIEIYSFQKEDTIPIDSIRKAFQQYKDRIGFAFWGLPDIAYSYFKEQTQKDLKKLLANTKIYNDEIWFYLLHWYSRMGLEEPVKELIKNGAGVDAVTKDNLAPLHLIAQHGNTESHVNIAKLLIDNSANVNAVTEKEKATPLHVIAQHGNTESHENIAKLLIENGAGVNAVAEDKWTPLHIIAQHGNTESHVKIAKLLIEKAMAMGILKEYLYQKDGPNNKTAVEIARYWGNTKITTLLEKYL